MSDSRKKRAGTKRKLAIDHPFDPAILKRAREIVAAYRILLEPEPEEGFIGRVLEEPIWMGVGRTPDTCVKETRGLAISAVATMLEMGEAPPTPAAQNLRNEQINIRVTAEEKVLLEEAARSKGFRGISDFVRSTTLSTLRSA